MTEIISTSKEINDLLESQRISGGKTELKTGCHLIKEPVMIDTPSQRLSGEIWAYNLDPNGVFETPFGTKLKLKGMDHPAISIGITRPPAGCMVSDVGIQGDIVGMDTRGSFDPKRPYAAAGLYFGSQRVDQGDFSKISCCGLACAVSIADNAEIDACDFRKINTDGCCVGIYFSPRASYYAHFSRCIAADNPSYGFFADGTGEKQKNIHNIDITDVNFVRNCGANHLNDVNCAVYLKNVDNFIFRDNLVDSPGVFWYYEPDETSNRNKTVYKSKAAGLVIIGNKNKVMNNVFSKSSAESVNIKGDGNILTCNIADNDVVIEGEGNVVTNLCFNSKDARLILKGKAKNTTVISGVNQDNIINM